MSEFGQIVSALREQMNATLSRSDVLKPLSWLAGMLLLAVVGSAAVKAPEWLMITEAAMLVLTVMLYLTAYIFCLRKDRDALRSEKYSLHKMAIEHGLYGDSRIGLIEPSSPTDQDSPKSITGPTGTGGA